MTDFSLLTIVYTESSWGYLLWLPFLLLLLFSFLKKHQIKVLFRFGSQGVSKDAGKSGSKSFSLFWLRAFCVAFSAFLALVSLMQPENRAQVKEEATKQKEAKAPIDELAFIVDVSDSMGAEDSLNSDKTRFFRAKEFVGSITDRLGGINISLYAFAGNTLEVVPVTMDYLYSGLALENLKLNETSKAGTDFAELFHTMKKRYIDSPYRKKVAFVLLSDGEDTTFLGLNPDVERQKEASTLHILDDFKKAMPWYVIGVGSEKGAIVPGISFEGKSVVSKMRRGFLQAISELTLGKSYFAENASLLDIVDDLIFTIFKSKRGENAAEAKGSQLFYYPLLAAALLLLIALLIPEKIDVFQEEARA